MKTIQELSTTPCVEVNNFSDLFSGVDIRKSDEEGSGSEETIPVLYKYLTPTLNEEGELHETGFFISVDVDSNLLLYTRISIDKGPYDAKPITNCEMDVFKCNSIEANKLIYAIQDTPEFKDAMNLESGEKVVNELREILGL